MRRKRMLSSRSEHAPLDFPLEHRGVAARRGGHARTRDAPAQGPG